MTDFATSQNDLAVPNTPPPQPASPLVPENEVVIHAMPKRFIGSRTGAKKTKGIGLVILLGGVVFLAAALAFFYFYLIRKDAPSVPATDRSAEVKTDLPADRTPKQPEPADETEAHEEEASEPTVSTSSPEFDPEEEESFATTSESGEASSTRVIDAPATSTPIVQNKAQDSDGDGLSDAEEILFDCNIDTTDSDGDGYGDLAEILNFYNPAGGGSVITNPNIEKYINSAYNYALYYPYTWPVADLGGEDSIMFTMGSNQFIQVIVTPNPGGKSLEEWFEEQLGMTAVPEKNNMYKKGWWALKSDDGLTVYLAKPDDDNFFVLSYNLGLSGIPQYRNIFDFMVKSLEIDN